MTARRVLIAVRHGRTAWNAVGRFQGHADPPLDATGRGQGVDASRHVGLALAAAGAGDRPTVISSDLQRAAATAGRIAGDLGVPLILDARLREVDLGAWEGLAPEEAQRRFPSEWADWTAGRDLRRGGGETEGEAGVRVAAAIDEILSEAAGSGGEALIVVGHGLSLRAGLDQLRAGGVIDFAGRAPHLGNGGVLVVPPRPRPLRIPSFV
jgi:glucosyl-3-phosphoglycerate phosphatase